jgi:hypothetical protein
MTNVIDFKTSKPVDFKNAKIKEYIVFPREAALEAGKVWQRNLERTLRRSKRIEWACNACAFFTGLSLGLILMSAL